MTGSSTGYRVGIDGYNLAIPRGTGVATYGRSLSQCLRLMGHPVDVLFGLDIDPTLAPVLRQVAFFEQLQTERPYRRPRYPSPGWGRAMLRAWRGDDAVPIPVDGRVDARVFQGRMPEHDRILNVRHLFARAAHFFHNFGRLMPVRMADPPAIMHWTYPVPVRLVGARNIYTVHDVVPLKMPYATLDHKPTHSRLLAECIRLGDQICTVSERSRDDLLGFYPDTPPERVTNTYQAVLPADEVLRPEHVQPLLREAYGLEPGRYFLFFGSIEPKKNVGRLLQGYIASGVSLPMVVVTARGWQADPEVEALLRHKQVRQIEYVPLPMLTTLIRHARAVTFPSVYEGFGLPVLEAMQLGTPVLTTHEGSLAEIAGDAAELVEAYDIGSIATGLQRLATDDARCDDLRRLGEAQAERFSMARYQERVRALYDTVMARPARIG